MKLIFLHQAKAGGATLRNILDANMKWFCLDDIPINTSSEEIYRCCMEADIINLMSFSYSLKERLGKYFNDVIKESIVLAHVRSPINLFESEWRYELQKGSDDSYASTHLPHDPIFNKNKIGQAPNIRSMYDYLERDKKLRININEWFEIASQGENENGVILPISKDDLPNQCWYRDTNLCRRGFSIFQINKQYEAIIKHFGTEVFAKGCEPNKANTTIIIPTEILNESIAAHILINNQFRNFTKLNGHTNTSYKNILEDVKSLKKKRHSMI